METDMKRLLTTLALVLVLAPAAMAQSYSNYDPAHANTADPGSAPLMRDRAPAAFVRDNAALANTADPGSAPLMVDPPASYRGIKTDPAAIADTADPESVHVWRNSR
jgi:hypothetical protein